MNKLENNQVKRQVVNPANNQVLTYFITSQTNTNSYLLDWPMISSEQNILPIELSGGNAPIQRIPIYIWVDVGQSVQPGVFSGELGINLYKGKFNVSNLSEPIIKGVIPITIEVSNQIEVSLGDKTFNQFTDFNVKFEQLKEGATVKYDAFVNAFGNYKLIIKSKGKDDYGTQSKRSRQAFLTPFTWMASWCNLMALESIKKPLKRGQMQHSPSIMKLVLGDVSHAFKGLWG